jgi:hypothetical protein
MICSTVASIALSHSQQHLGMKELALDSVICAIAVWKRQRTAEVEKL